MAQLTVSKEDKMKFSNTQIEVFEEIPENFNSHIQVAACYLEIENKLLLLQSTKLKSEPETWGVPAGKLEKNENAEEAARRELFEETGISVDDSSQIQSLGALYMRKPGIDYVYHLFCVNLDNVPSITLSNEHQDYRWSSPEEIDKMALMCGAKEALMKYQINLKEFQINSNKKKTS